MFWNRDEQPVSQTHSTMTVPKVVSVCEVGSTETVQRQIAGDKDHKNLQSETVKNQIAADKDNKS